VIKIVHKRSLAPGGADNGPPPTVAAGLF
jgi:hypothetical protein